MCVCVCVCVRERERETETETETETDRERERDRQTDRQSQRDRDRDTETQRQRAGRSLFELEGPVYTLNILLITLTPTPCGELMSMDTLIQTPVLDIDCRTLSDMGTL